jgi:hypothetical protein
MNNKVHYTHKENGMKVYITHVAYVERIYLVDVDDPDDLDLDEIELGKPIAEIDTEDEPNEYECYREDKMHRYLSEAISEANKTA